MGLKSPPILLLLFVEHLIIFKRILTLLRMQVNIKRNVLTCAGTHNHTRRIRTRSVSFPSSRPYIGY